MALFNGESGFLGDGYDAEPFVAFGVALDGGGQGGAAVYHGVAHLVFPIGWEGGSVCRDSAQIGFDVKGYDVCVEVALHFLAECFDGDLPGFEVYS